MSDYIKAFFGLLLEGVFDDLRSMSLRSGTSLWLGACHVANPELLRKLLSVGCDAAEVHNYDRQLDQRHRNILTVTMDFSS